MHDDGTPTSTEIAWAAGLFEGEGSFFLNQHQHGRRASVAARLAMTDEDVVDRFAVIVGVGYRHKARDSGPAHWKPLHGWATQAAPDVIFVAELFLPYLGQRRTAKAIEVIAAARMVEVPNGERTHCPQGHPYSGDNLVFETVGVGPKKHLARRCRECRRKGSRDRARRRLGTDPASYRVHD